MLKRTTDRAYTSGSHYGERPLGEPEAWGRHHGERTTYRGYGTARAAPAPWHQPYAEERVSASDFARRPSPRPSPSPSPSPSPRPSQRSNPRARSAMDGAGHEDFRHLARSIESMREHRFPDDGGRATERRSTTWLDDVRRHTDRDEARSRTTRGAGRTGASPASHAADTHEIRALEAQLRALSERVAKLEEGRSSPRAERASRRADAAREEAARARYDTEDAYTRPPAAGPYRPAASVRREGGPRRLWP